MVAFKAEILKSKQKVDGTYNVKIRITTLHVVSHLRHVVWHKCDTSVAGSLAFCYF